MAGLSPQKIAMLRTLVSASPDELVRVLDSAISADGAGGPLAAIGAMVEAEAAERALRFAVLAPVAPLFRPATGDERPAFPRAALGALWLALKDDAPDLVREAADAMRYLDPEEPIPSVFDELCARAANGMIEEGPGYVAAIAACETSRPGSAADLILCLRLAPIVRPAVQRLGDWIQRMTDERRATARLAYRDAAGLADGAGPLLFEMLAAHLKQPSAILRVISAVMDRPGERYVADSELARFGERSLSEIENQLVVIKDMKPGAGIVAGREAGQAVQRAIDDAATHALPMQKIRYSAKLTRTAPNLTAPPDEPAIAWAMGLLTFSDVVRVSATDGGFGTVRTKVLDALGKRIDQYVEDLLEQIRLGEV